MFRNAAVACEYRRNVILGRSDADAGNKIGFGQNGSVRFAGPFLDAARAGVVGGERHRGLGRAAAILFAEFFKIPAADLYVAFGVGEETC